MPDILLQVHDLAAEAGERRLFAGLNVRLESGGAIVVSGANGSGKSTLLRIVAGLRDGTSGAVETHAPLTYVGHALGLKAELTGADHERFWRRLSGGQGSDDQGSDDRDPFSVHPFADLPVAVLSRGQKQRLALSRLRTGRRVWLLDEPSGPLDAEGEAALVAEIERHRAMGGAVMVATHRPLAIQDPQELRLR